MSFGRSRQAKPLAASKHVVIAAGIGSAILALSAAPTHSQTGPATSEAKLLSDARGFVGKPVRVDGIYCVDPGSRGFTCLKRVGGQILLVEGLTMGAKTAQAIAELLIGDCKGTANLNSSRCLMSVEFEPTATAKEMISTEAGSIQRVTIHTSQIEFYRPSRGR